MIQPTVGRVVWYRPSESDTFPKAVGQPLPAIITIAWDMGLVNLVVFDGDGNTHGRTSVRLVQPNDEAPGPGGYCEWMPYQIGQAQRTEQAEKALADKN